MTCRFHHVGIGTKLFDEAIATYEALHHECFVRVDDQDLGVRVAFLRSAGGGPLLEILAPLGDHTPLRSLIERRLLPSPYHTCYAVENLAGSAERLRELGFMPVGEARPALAFAGQPIQFFLNRAVGLIELVEEPPF